MHSGLIEKIDKLVRQLQQPAGPSPLFATAESISKNRESFVLECHKTWKELYDEAIRQLLLWEGFLKREKSHPIGRMAEEFGEYNRRIWRRVNDSIVWSLVGLQRHLIKRICLYRPRGNLLDSNPEAARSVIASLNANPKSIANDATTCVDIGDLTYVRDGLKPNLEFLELKEGTVNEEIVELIHLSESEFETRFAEFAAKRGKDGVNQYKRVLRQKEISKQALTLLSDDKGLNPVTGMDTRVLDLGGLGTETYDREFGEVAREALKGARKEVLRQVADCIWVYANADQKVPWPEVYKRAQSAIAAQVPSLDRSLAAQLPSWDRDRIVSLAQAFAEPLAIPIFLRSLDADLIASLTCGELMFRVYLYIDWERFAGLVRQAGVEFTWGSEKAARRARSWRPTVRPPVIGGRLAQIQVDDAIFQITDSNLVQILFDGVTPKTIIESLMHAAKLINEDPSLLPDPIR